MRIPHCIDRLICRGAAILVPLVLGASLGAEEFDLTPRKVMTFVEGPDIERHYFRHGEDRYVYSPPDHARVFGGKDRMTLSFEDDPGGSRIEISPSILDPVAVPFFTEGRMDSHYPVLARKQVPGGAVDVGDPAVSKDPLPINEWSSIEFVYDYQMDGAPRRMAVIFLNFTPEDQLLITIEAGKERFPAIYSIGRKIFNRLHRLRPGEEVKPDPYS